MTKTIIYSNSKNSSEIRQQLSKFPLARFICFDRIPWFFKHKNAIAVKTIAEFENELFRLANSPESQAEVLVIDDLQALEALYTTPAINAFNDYFNLTKPLVYPTETDNYVVHQFIDNHLMNFFDKLELLNNSQIIFLSDSREKTDGLDNSIYEIPSLKFKVLKKLTKEGWEVVNYSLLNKQFTPNKDDAFEMSTVQIATSPSIFAASPFFDSSIKIITFEEYCKFHNLI